jgi:hypothetical protein
VRTSTELRAVERNDHWSVMIAWPNGAINHFGKFSSERAAIVWINDHHWMTTNVIPDLRRLRRGGRPKVD